MSFNEIGSKNLVQRIIDILSNSTDPDLRTGSGRPIKKYIFGLPDEGELPDQYPVIAVIPGTPEGGSFIEDAGFGSNTNQKMNLITASIYLIERDSSAETVEKTALDRHDDIRVVLRKNADLRNPTDNTNPLVEKVPLTWTTLIERSRLTFNQDFVIEVVLIARWILLEDTVI